MKIAVQCESPLLQRSLEMMLQENLCSVRHCDAVLRDREIDDSEHRSLFVAANENADIVKPFTRSQLMMRLHELLMPETAQLEVDKSVSGSVDFSVLEKRIAQLTQEYQKNILTAVRAFYES